MLCYFILTFSSINEEKKTVKNSLLFLSEVCSDGRIFDFEHIFYVSGWHFHSVFFKQGSGYVWASWQPGLYIKEVQACSAIKTAVSILNGKIPRQNLQANLFRPTFTKLIQFCSRDCKQRVMGYSWHQVRDVSECETRGSLSKTHVKSLGEQVVDLSSQFCYTSYSFNLSVKYSVVYHRGMANDVNDGEPRH